MIFLYAFLVCGVICMLAQIILDFFDLTPGVITAIFVMLGSLFEFFDLYDKVIERPNIVGWCETSIGYMGIFECPHCFNKYRFHCTIGTYNADIDEFDIYLYYKARECKNWSEIKVKLF